jgi:NADPH oxidase
MRERFERWMVNEGSRRFVVAVFVLVHGLIFGFGFMNYQLKDNLTGARATFGITYPIARSAALVLHFDIALILFPVCRTLISLLRQTPLNSIVPFDKNLTFHKLVAYSIVFFTWVHTIAHWNNFAQLAAKANLGFVGFLKANFVTGPGWSGYIMLFALMAMLFTSIEKPRRANYERFWSVHHLFIIFFVFWSVHGAFCMIKADTAPFCFGTGVFWEYWMYGGFAYLMERVLREIRGRHKTFVTKVIQHPSNVVEIQMHKEKTKTRAGQYIFLCCPEISIWQYHPFTLTSAPEEDYISVHVRMVGNFTKALGKALGCDDGKASKDAGAKKPRSEVVSMAPGGLQKLLPRIYLDGPFGSASEDVFKFETAVLVGAGIGVTPFASILKSIWYRMSQGGGGQSRLRKVYFFWVCRDFGTLEWFKSLLQAIEAQDKAHAIEIHAVSFSALLVILSTHQADMSPHSTSPPRSPLRMPTTSCSTAATPTPSPACAHPPTSAAPTGTWSSGPYASCTLPARLACSSAAPRAWARNSTSCATCTAKATRASASSGARRTSKPSSPSADRPFCLALAPSSFVFLNSKSYALRRIGFRGSGSESESEITHRRNLES